MQFTVKFPHAEIQRATKAAQAKMAQHQRDVLEAVGVKLLSFAKQDYRTKSRGGTGTDGITWKPLAAATIKRKNGTSTGKKNSKRRVTKGGKARPGIGSSAIGIDSGLQQNSASPGFKGPDPEGGLTGNVLEVTETSVTVGFGRSYSEHFDAVRPLLPTTLPDAWREGCEEIVVRHGERIIGEELDS